MQRSSAGAARRQLIEEHPGVVFHLLQLPEDFNAARRNEDHAHTLAKRGAGRSRGARKSASLIDDSAYRLAASISNAPITTPTPKLTPTAVHGFCCTVSSA